MRNHVSALSDGFETAVYKPGLSKWHSTFDHTNTVILQLVDNVLSWRGWIITPLPFGSDQSDDNWFDLRDVQYRPTYSMAGGEFETQLSTVHKTNR